MTVRIDALGAPIASSAQPESPRFRGGALRQSGRALARLIEIRPHEDVIMVLLLGAMLATVAWSVQLAGWLNGPTTQPTVLVAGFTGALVARARGHWSAGHLAGLAIGFVFVVWQAGQSASGASILDTSREVWERYFAWLAAAREGGISRDALPFELMLLATSWVVAYFAGWVLFRWRNAWFSVLLLGTGIVVNLSWRPGRFEYTLFIFIALAIVLFAHVTSMQRVAGWVSSGVRFPAPLGRLNLQYGLLVAAAVVVISALMPLWEPRSDSLTGFWARLREPITALEDPFSRLLSGVRGGGRSPLAPFKDTLPFTGAVQFKDEPVAFVDTTYPTPHPGRIYTRYTREGWLTGATAVAEVTGGVPLAGRAPVQEREVITQRFFPSYATDWVMSAGNTVSMDRAGLNEYLVPLQFTIAMVPGDLDPALPDDLRAFAEALRRRFLFSDEPAPGSVVDEILARTPRTLRVISYGLNASGRLSSVRVGRYGAVPEEQIGFSFRDPVAQGESYSVRQLVSKATDEQLNAAGTDYPLWTSDRYLQLPADLPKRVSALARSIVEDAGAQTPFEKTVAISSYLRGLGYSRAIKGPKAEQDGVDYFLFETQDEPCPQDGTPFPCQDGQAKAYSQYFGSAAAVLLRAVGVPARMVAGYAAGTYLPSQGRFEVLDSDRHGWAQAYFPGYGWIDVEATPGYAVYTRGAAFDVASGEANRPAPGSAFRDDYYPEDEEAFLVGPVGAGLAPKRGSRSAVSVIAVAVLATLGGVAGLALLALVLWHYGMSALTPARRTYVKVNRLAWLAGLRRTGSQTVSEYAGFLANRVPAAGEAIQAIADAYQLEVYGPRRMILGQAQDGVREREARDGVLRPSTGSGWRAPDSHREREAPPQGSGYSGADESLEVQWRRARPVLIRRALGRMLGQG